MARWPPGHQQEEAVGQGGGGSQEGERGDLDGKDFFQGYHREGKVLDEVIFFFLVLSILYSSAH